MKVYLITMFWCAAMVLAIRIINDYQNHVNPFNEPLAVVNYLIVIFWIIFFSVMYFKKYKRIKVE